MKLNAVGNKYQNMRAIGDNLTILRKHNGATMRRISNKSGISSTTIYKLEKGECHLVGFLKLIALCDYYGVTPSEVVTEGYFSNPEHIKNILRTR